MAQYVAAWKSGVEVHWRSVTWSEFRSYTDRLRYDVPMVVYCDLYRDVLISGPERDKAPAGVVDYVARSVIENNPFSGKFEDVQRALYLKREANSGYLQQSRALVAGIFRYTFEEIDTWDADTFFERLAQAEFLAGRTIEPVAPLTEAEIKEAEDIRTGRKRAPAPKRVKKQMTPSQQLAYERKMQNPQY